jgi:hypothetical protein
MLSLNPNVLCMGGKKKKKKKKEEEEEEEGKTS